MRDEYTYFEAVILRLTILRDITIAMETYHQTQPQQATANPASADSTGGRGLHVRLAKPEDADAIEELFCHGMYSTISGGLRKRIRGMMHSHSPAIGGCALAATALCLYEARTRPFIAALGASAAAGFAYMYGYQPHAFASDYIEGSLRDDYLQQQTLRQILEQQQQQQQQQQQLRQEEEEEEEEEGRSSSPWAIWVAEDVTSGLVIGTVAVEPAKTSPCPRTAFQWSDGDAELRRMSVHPSAQKRGVARAMFDALLKHVRTLQHTANSNNSNNNSSGTRRGGGGTSKISSSPPPPPTTTTQPYFKRITLSTSTMQHVAYNHLYPKLGFTMQEKRPIAQGLAEVGYFVYQV